jgi:hypothetical protein
MEVENVNKEFVYITDFRASLINNFSSRIKNVPTRNQQPLKKALRKIQTVKI